MFSSSLMFVLGSQLEPTQADQAKASHSIRLGQQYLSVTNALPYNTLVNIATVKMLWKLFWVIYIIFGINSVRILLFLYQNFGQNYAEKDIIGLVRDENKPYQTLGFEIRKLFSTFRNFFCQNYLKITIVHVFFICNERGAMTFTRMALNRVKFSILTFGESLIWLCIIPLSVILLCASLQSNILTNVILVNVILHPVVFCQVSFWKYNSAKWHSPKCHVGECNSTVNHSAKWHSTNCNVVECLLT